MKIAKIRVPIYHDFFYLVYNTSHDELLALLRRKYPGIELDDSMKDPGYDGKYFRMYNKDKGISDFYIYVEKFDWSISSQGTLAHEIFHATLAFLKYFGINITVADDGCYEDEAHAYLFKFLLEEIWLKLKPLSIYHKRRCRVKRRKTRKSRS